VSAQIVAQKVVGKHHEEYHEALPEDVYLDLMDDEDLLASVTLSRELQDSRDAETTVSLSVWVTVDCSPCWIQVAKARLETVMVERLGKLLVEHEEERKRGLGT
jgi:hypothetical protein